MSIVIEDLDIAEASLLFRALSDERRLRILTLLRRGERCVCDLTEALGVGQSLLSFHLRVLREAGLVSDRRQGRWSYYSLVPERFDEVAALAGAFCGGEDEEEDFLAGPCCG